MISKLHTHKEKKSKQRSFVSKYFLTFFLALTVVVVINKFLFFNVVIPSDSMAPTVNTKDRVLALRIHDLSSIKRKDILVVYSSELNEPLLKRVIGLPNDKVSIRENGIYIDGKKLYEPYIKSAAYTKKEFIVPSDSYFFLGDNRNNSYDSRSWKEPYINKKDILGRAVYRYFPFNKVGNIK